MLGTQCTGHRKEARGFEESGIYSSSISLGSFLHCIAPSSLVLQRSYNMDIGSPARFRLVVFLCFRIPSCGLCLRVRAKWSSIHPSTLAFSMLLMFPSVHFPVEAVKYP